VGVRSISVGIERGTRRASVLRTADVAWVAVLPCVLVTAVVVALLGPPLGRAFLGPSDVTFWPTTVPAPEPEEHGRYLLSLLGPALLAAAVLASARWSVRAGDALTRRLALATQLLLAAFVVLCFAAQYDLLVSAYRPQWEAHVRYFTVPTLLVALALPALLLALMRRPGAAARVARLVHETPARRVAALVAAVLFTAVWLLTAVNADGSLANISPGVAGHILWSMDEPFAILNGRTPLVDFHAQYGQLVPYLAAGSLAVFGASIGTFTITMALGSGLALLALYAVLRRIARSSLLALLLFMPLVASGFFMKIGPLSDRYGPANLFSLWPIRYGGPYLIAWLLSRHLDRLAPRRVWLLFLVAGFTLINNPEFGAGAVAALAVALVAVDPPRTRGAAGRLLAEAAAGMLGALAVVVLFTLARSGSLPHLGWSLEFSKLYGNDGWALVPLPRIGVYLVLYITFAAAIAVAAVRIVRGEPDRVLTAMLAWSGVFGLIAGGYFAGRSHPQVLIDLFSPWALSLALLMIVAVRALAAREWRRPGIPELAVLFGFALMACSLAQTPTPWSQIHRIRDLAPVPIFRQPAAQAFVKKSTRPGEKVAILIALGHRIAYDTGRVNVAPYASVESMPTTQQLTDVLATIRREGADKIFFTTQVTPEDEQVAIQEAGFDIKAHVPDGQGAEIVELVDAQ
jgi:hypothetical protein